LRESRIILGIGELLWDIVEASSPPSEADSTGTLGGAPTNFTVMAGRLGNRACILSRVGRDDLGRRAVGQLDTLPVDASLIQVDPAHQTGQVTVSFAANEPKYTIHQPAAWDFLELSDEWIKIADRADAICFGTLAQRDAASRQTIQTLVAQTSSSCVRVLDVNLRAPFYSSEILQESIELATMVKMNIEEISTVLGLLGLAAGEDPPLSLRNTDYLRTCSERLLEEFPALELVAITRGHHGSVLVKRDTWHEHPGFSIKVADTIGAGDAFTAAMVHYLLREAKLATINEAGNRWGSWVASQPGAMPDLPESVHNAISAAIERSA